MSCFSNSRICLNFKHLGLPSVLILLHIIIAYSIFSTCIGERGDVQLSFLKPFFKVNGLQTMCWNQNTASNKLRATAKSSVLTFYDPTQSNRSAEKLDADIIFIHGLNGGALKTWRQLDIYNNLPRPKSSRTFTKPNILRRNQVTKLESKIGNGNKLSQFPQWPIEMLPLDFPNCRILSVHYDSIAFRKLSSMLFSLKRTRPTNSSKSKLIPKALDEVGISDLTQSILEKLKQAKIGFRPLIFITHSLGGILAKSIILSDEKFSELTKGVIFFGVPHHGSSIGYPNWLKPLLSQTSLELLDSNSMLHNIQKEFLKTALEQEIDCISFVESKRSKLFFNLIKSKSVLVPLKCANPMIGDVIQVGDVDHMEVCKPLARFGDIRYESILRFIRTIL